jgi:peptide/nickel transport system permease protein
MLSEGRGYLRDQWWISTFPGLAIMLTVLAMNLLGDGLRDALDPRLKV